MKYSIWILTLVMVLALGACIDDTNNSGVTIQERDEEIIENYLADNNITDFQRTDLGVYYHSLKEGTGQSIPSDSIMVLGYKGFLPYGNVFDNSFARGTSLDLLKSTGAIASSYDTINCYTNNNLEVVCDSCPNLGGGVIRGWVDAMQVLKVGDRKRFYIPSSLGYGSAGSGGIPGNAVLIFDIEAYRYKGYLEECL